MSESEKTRLDTIKLESEAIVGGRSTRVDATFKTNSNGELGFTEANIGSTSPPLRGGQQNTWTLGVTGNESGAIDGVKLGFESSPSKREVVFGTHTQDYRLADGSIRKIELPSITSNYDAGVDRFGTGVTATFKPVELITTPQVTGTPFVSAAIGWNTNGQTSGTLQTGVDINAGNGGISVGVERQTDRQRNGATTSTTAPRIDDAGSANALGSTMERLYAPSMIKQESPVLNGLSAADKKLHDQAIIGIEKLNTQGAGMPVNETAASLLLLAKQKNLGSIDYVITGKVAASGQENIFIGTGTAGSVTSDRAYMSKQEAMQTPVEKSLQSITQQNELSPQQAQAKSTLEIKNTEQVSNPVRAI